jgi:hypothetical protein
MLRWKDSVRFGSLHPAIVLALLRAEALYQAEGVDCWITSLNDSRHMVGSKHYLGCAVDLRIWDLPETSRAPMAQRLKAALGPQFFVLLEPTHIHIQYNGEL